MSAAIPGHLELTEAQMRSFGYSVIDLLVRHFSSLPQKSVGRRAGADELKHLNEGLPQGSEPQLVLERVERDVLSNILHLDHPRFLGFVPGPSNFVSVMADTLASGFNVFAGTWLEASGPAQVELVVLDWLKTLLRLPDTAEGVLVSGGSHANLTALAVMRRVRLEDDPSRAVVYASDQTHASVARALRMLGFAAQNYRRLRSTDGKLDPEDLKAAVGYDRDAGLTPACIIANAGTTNTGAVDPLDELAAVSEATGLWLHVDGAYGAAAAISRRGRALMRGLERADSVSLDPHKWLFQPYEIGCVFLRRREQLGSTFRLLPEYLQNAVLERGEVNFCDRGIQLTRGFGALKLWMSLEVFGAEAFRAAVERGMGLAEEAERILRGRADWEIITPAQLGIVTFRWRPAAKPNGELDRLNAALVDAMLADGYLFASSTVINGRTVQRFCTINPRTSDEDLRASIDRMEALARRLA